MNVLVAIFVLVLGLFGPAQISVGQSHENAADPAVTLDELQKKLEEEQKPLLLDVRLASDFDEAPILEGGIEAWKESGRDVIPAKRE